MSSSLTILTFFIFVLATNRDASWAQYFSPEDNLTIHALEQSLVPRGSNYKPISQEEVIVQSLRSANISERMAQLNAMERQLGQGSGNVRPYKSALVELINLSMSENEVVASKSLRIIELYGNVYSRIGNDPENNPNYVTKEQMTELVRRIPYRKEMGNFSVWGNIHRWAHNGVATLPQDPGMRDQFMNDVLNAAQFLVKDKIGPMKDLKNRPKAQVMEALQIYNDNADIFKLSGHSPEFLLSIILRSEADNDIKIKSLEILEEHFPEYLLNNQEELSSLTGNPTVTNRLGRSLVRAREATSSSGGSSRPTTISK